MTRHIPAVLFRLALAVLLTLGAATSVQVEAACARNIIPQASNITAPAGGEHGEERQSTPHALHCAASHCANGVAVAEPAGLETASFPFQQAFAQPTTILLEAMDPSTPERPPQR